MRAREVMNRDGGKGVGRREGGREEESWRRCSGGEDRERGSPHTSVKNSLCRESRLALSLLPGEEERCVGSVTVGTCKIISINFLRRTNFLMDQPWPSRS